MKAKYNKSKKPRFPLNHILDEMENDKYFNFSFEDDIQTNKFDCKFYVLIFRL